jgi:hypothetical protein
MINHASLARAILTTKLVNVEPARAMGQRNRGPWDPEHSRKMREALSILNAISREARRYYRAERRSRWLTNCIVTHADRKTFDLKGVAPDGIPYDIHIEMPLDATLLDFLLLVMRCEDAPMVMRLDCAKTAAPLMHEKPRRTVGVVIERERRSSHVAGRLADPGDSDR